MSGILRNVYGRCQRIVEGRSSEEVTSGMPNSAPIEEERRSIGRRLAAARKLAGYTLESAASALTQQGTVIGKAAIGAWETGRNLPDALWLRRLAKLYETSIDALLWENALSMEAMQIGAEFDSLNEREQKRLKSLWQVLVRDAVGDAAVEDRMPITRTEKV